jgi:MazG nucleotide pyrophosphohydrolase domain.
MDLDAYQATAGASNALSHVDELRALNAALFGLASETGTLLDIQKKVLTDAADPVASNVQFQQELGDLLWYVSRVANAKGFTLQQIADANLDRVQDMWEPEDLAAAMAQLPRYDANVLATEQFPRRMTFEFVESTITRAGTRHPSATMTLVSAEPNAFPDGAIPRGSGKVQGFLLPQEVGAELTDNSRKVDGYRYHDAIHIAFMATLNWSATMRSLLNLKRKTDDDADEFDDSARPIFLEEGLVAVLAGLSTRRMGFAAASNVDGDALAAARACIVGLEVEKAPGWLWRRAIVKGFEMLRELDAHGGGRLYVDLDARTVEFGARPPRLTRSA